MANDLTQAKRLIKECQETQDPYLDLGNCGITDLNHLPELFECAHLETLILCPYWWWDAEGRKRDFSKNKGQNNQLNTIPSKLEGLKNLKILIACGDDDAINFELINFLSKLTGLQSLDLRFNQISDISSLENLTGLQSLYLFSNKISDISPLEKLTGLQSLDLSGNKISDYSFLEN